MGPGAGNVRHATAGFKWKSGVGFNAEVARDAEIRRVIPSGYFFASLCVLCDLCVKTRNSMMLMACGIAWPFHLGLLKCRRVSEVQQEMIEACWFDPERGNEVVWGTLSVDRWELKFLSDAFSESIPLERLSLDVDDRGERIYLRDAARPELTVYTLDYSILDFARIPGATELRNRLSEFLSKQELKKRVRMIGYFVIGFIVLFWMGSMALGLMVRSLVAKVPAEWEESFGAQVIQEMQQEEIFVTDSNQLARLEAVAQPLLEVVPAGRRPAHFYIIEEESPNAFALPGGPVVVTTGLLEMVDTPEELLGVLAHEMAHVSEKHIARSLIASAGPMVIFGIFLHSGNGLANLLSVGSQIMVQQGFSQEYEIEADDVGWKYLVKANIDPRGMISTFKKLKAWEQTMDLGLDLPQAFSSHPALDKRIARLERRWNRLSQQSGFVTLTNAIPKPDPDHDKPALPPRTRKQK